jgi:hypothetical protein
MPILPSLAPATAALLALLALPLQVASAGPDCPGDPDTVQRVMRETQAAANSGCAGDPVSGHRLALVIGISAYGGQNAVSGVQDARDMGCYLQQLGFTLVGPAADRPGPLRDAEIGDIKDALEQFKSGIAMPNVEVALFYFSGHGFQQDNQDYLVPKGASFTKEGLLQLSQVILKMRAARQGTKKIILLDACRNNEDLIVEGKRLGETSGWHPGMARVQDKSFSGFVGFSTHYDQSAGSGPVDGNSPYTVALLAHLRDPGLQFHQLLTGVRAEVEHATCGDQSPWSEGDIASYALRPPATVKAQIEFADDDLAMVTVPDGRQLLSWGNAPKDAQNKALPIEVPLTAGDNRIELRVYNQKTYRNHHAWEPPEGWKYRMKLTTQDGTDLPPFEGAETYVFRDGPHHGKWFKVATGNLNVSGEGKVKVTLTAPDLEVWKREGPEDATDQTILCGVELASLPLLNVQHRIDLLIGGRRGLEERLRTCITRQLQSVDPLHGALGLDAARTLVKGNLLIEYVKYLQGSDQTTIDSQTFGPISGCVSEGKPKPIIWFAIDDRVGGGDSLPGCGL